METAIYCKHIPLRDRGHSQPMTIALEGKTEKGKRKKGKECASRFGPATGFSKALPSRPCLDRGMLGSRYIYVSVKV